jgi:hypothetical protein
MYVYNYMTYTISHCITLITPCSGNVFARLGAKNELRQRQQQPFNRALTSNTPSGTSTTGTDTSHARVETIADHAVKACAVRGSLPPLAGFPPAMASRIDSTSIVALAQDYLHKEHGQPLITMNLNPPRHSLATIAKDTSYTCRTIPDFQYTPEPFLPPTGVNHPTNAHLKLYRQGVHSLYQEALKRKDSSLTELVDCRLFTAKLVATTHGGFFSKPDAQ